VVVDRHVPVRGPDPAEIAPRFVVGAIECRRGHRHAGGRQQGLEIRQAALLIAVVARRTVEE